MKHNIRQLSMSILMVAICVGCSTFQQDSIPRNPVPEELYIEAEIAGIENARAWGDIESNTLDRWHDMSESELRSNFSGIFETEHNYLVVSGGGARGAYGAGLLNGWTAKGTRPDFTIVTGISTGALIAPFAFLGSEYDPVLKLIYSQYSPEDLLEVKDKYVVLRALFFQKTSFASVDPLKELLKEHLNDEVIAEIAREYKKGRMLYIGTTNLDAIRPAYWNIGLIASSRHPKAGDLIRQVVLASVSIPVAFPPVMIEVEANGQLYDEMHVDGGATNQAFLFQPQTDWKVIKEHFRVKGDPKVFLIRNAKLEPKWIAVKPNIREIGGRSVSSLLRTQGIGDAFQIYSDCIRDGLEFNLTFIPSTFTTEAQEMFDKEYMIELFELGYQFGMSGDPWYSRPVAFSPKEQD